MTNQEWIVKISQRKPWQSAEENYFEAERMEQAEKEIDKFEEWKKRMNIQTRRMW